MSLKSFIMQRANHHAPPASPQRPSLQLLHGSNVGGLDVVLDFLDLVLQLIQGDLLVLDDQVLRRAAKLRRLHGNQGRRRADDARARQGPGCKGHQRQLRCSWPYGH